MDVEAVAERGGALEVGREMDTAEDMLGGWYGRMG